jgi:hypothetical protein
VLVRETGPDTYARIDHLPIAELVPGGPASKDARLKEQLPSTKGLL